MPAPRGAGSFASVPFELGLPELQGLPLNGMSRSVLSSGPFEAERVGAAFAPELAPRAGEPVLVKTSISPFKTTDLAARVQRRGLHWLVLAGVVTHRVVLGTALAANDRGVRVVVAKDACASGDPPRHELARAILVPLVELASVDELVGVSQAT